MTGLALAGLAGCVTPPAAHEGKPLAPIDPAITAAAATVWQTLDAPTRDAPFETVAGARLTSADSGLGPWLWSTGLVQNHVFLSRLKERGARYASVHVAYPILSGEERKPEAYAAAYAETRKEANSFGIDLIAVVEPQHRNDRDLRGYPVEDQCASETAERLAAHASNVGKVLTPAWLVLDLRPAVLASAPGCAEMANPDDAYALVTAVLARLSMPEGTRVAVAVDMEQDAEYRAQVLASTVVDAISIVTLDERSLSVAQFEQAWQHAVQAVESHDKTAISHAFWLRKPVSVPGCANGRPVVTDAAADWRRVDAELIARHVQGERPVVAYESELVFGGYLTEGFECGGANGEFGRKNRRLTALLSRKSRAYRRPASTN